MKTHPKHDEPHTPNDQTQSRDEEPAADRQAEEGPAQETGESAASPSEEEEDWKDKYIRLLAEFDNYRKRMAQEREEWFREGQARLALDLLAVMDDFERALEAFETTEDLDALKEGVRLIYKKLEKTLHQHDIRPIEAVGEPFNPDVHEAMTMIPAPDESMKNKVVEQVQKGYTHKGKVLRHPKVVVGK